MRKLSLISFFGAAVLTAACSCPSSLREVPAPGPVSRADQVGGLSRCQLKLYGPTLLGNANSPALVKALLARGAEPEGEVLINGKPYRGNAFLLVTNPQVVGDLAAAGCNPNVQGGPEGVTPLCNAIRQGNTELALALLAAGADPSFADSKGETPLFLAASRLDARLCQVLLNQGARPNLGRASDGTTPLLAVLKAGGNPEAMVQAKLPIAMMLLGAGADHLMSDAAGNMPMHFAPVDLMPTLMASGASVMCTNALGRNPLFFGGSRQRIDFLLQQGVNINTKDLEGNTAFDTVKDTALKSYILSRGGRSGKAI